MKFTSTCLVVFSMLPSSRAFAPQPANRLKANTALHEHKEAGGWLGPAVATVAGWTLAAQMAFADPMVAADQPVAPVLMSETPTMLVAEKVETMDFSMPSYGSAYSGDTVTGAKAAPEIPSFNPFGSSSSSEPAAPVKEDTSAADAAAKKAEEKAAAEAKKAEEKAAAEAKKAEEKAAAEAKKAEEEAKKAEKEARRLAEIEKQKEAVERAKQKKAEEAAAAAAKEESAAPEISIPSFSAPEMPEIKVPDIPKFDAPKMPEFSAPKVPEFSAPKVPEFSAPKIPEFSAPKVPEFSAPKASIPKFDAPKSSSSYDFDIPSSSSFKSVDEDVEPQEVRDARAKEARSAFLAADSEAKEIERQARALRDVANEKKKTAKMAKDEACKTRIGGKFLCVRPLGSGY